MGNLINMLLDFRYYSYIYEEDLIVELEFEYQPPDHNNNVSDLDFYGNYSILDLQVYYENGEPVIITGHKQKLLDTEVRDKVNQQLRLLEVDDSRFYENDIDRGFERYYVGED